MTEDAGTRGVAETEDITLAETGVDNSQKSDGRVAENNVGGDKCTSAVKSIFFSVIIVTAVGLAINSSVRLKGVKEQAFRDQVLSQAKEMKLYTENNVDAAFATLEGLTILTTSVVKRLAEETEYPPGFINIPDVSQTFGEAMNTSNALVIAYIPKVFPENFELWESYSRTHSSWLAEEQPGGPMNVTPEINDYIWEYTDYDWEYNHKRRLINEIVDGAPQNELRGNEPSRKLKKNRVIERPSDCSGSEEQRRRALATEDRRDLAKDDGGRELVSLGLDEDDDTFVPHNDDDEYDDYYHPGPSAQVGAPRSDEFHTPVWQLTPVPVLDETDPFAQIINYNLADRVVFLKAVEYIERSRKPVFLDVCDQSSWFLIDEHRDILQTVVAYPVFDDFSAQKAIVGYYAAIIPWTEFFKNTRGPYSKDMIIVMRNSCGEVFSIEITGERVTIVGEWDAHDPKFDDYVVIAPFAQQYNEAIKSSLRYDEEICTYTMYMYPTEK